VPARLIGRLGLEDPIDEHVDTGSSRPGRKFLTVVAAILASATHIDHVDLLRAWHDGGGCCYAATVPPDATGPLRLITMNSRPTTDPRLDSSRW
jgi:hypothetical protein